MKQDRSQDLIQTARELSDSVGLLKFSHPIVYVYNPLEYARVSHELYLSRFGKGRKKVVFLGMNPGPWGMAQTGVPFGEVEAVRDWMGIRTKVDAPSRQHPSRVVRGFDCHRSEISGKRVWALMRQRFGSAEEFFKEHFIANYCPLMFLEEGGRNRTPDKIPMNERKPLLEACDRHLLRIIEILQPEWVIGIGRFTLSRIESVEAAASQEGGANREEATPGEKGSTANQAGGGGDRVWTPETAKSARFRIGSIIHPSPANPQANRGWAESVTSYMSSVGLWGDEETRFE